MAFQLPNLLYAFNALEPQVDARTMEIHHGKHHVAYVTNVNKAIEGTQMDSWSVEQLISNIGSLPKEKHAAIRNNGGGHFNHSLFWNIMGPNCGGKPEGELMDSITKSFGTYDEFVSKFSTAGLTRFGSGWAWLLVSANGGLTVSSTPNQDNPLMQGLVEITGTPILGLDVWEHAYYLNYQNRRADYISAFWNVINWKAVAENFSLARKVSATV